jgi:hypothetical protein
MANIDLDRVLNRINRGSRYQERDFFYHADDAHLKNLTGGTFPAKVKSTHPVMIICIKSTGLSVAPCTRGPAEPQRYRFIRTASVKRSPISIPEATTYIIEDKSFPMPDDQCFWSSLTHHGQVPEFAIEGKFIPKGKI